MGEGGPEAMWFGRERARCFGMLHEPRETSSRGVVFCNALGFEGSIAHRAFRHMSDELAARGSWTLRFDYDGEGDSAGGPWEPGRVAAWMESIDAAVAVLRARGVTDVRLVGFRMGASLAHRYATTHAGVSRVVLWTPCIRGSGYVRELRALSRLSSVARPMQRVNAEPYPDDALEVVGFQLAGETLRDLAEIDLVAAEGSFVPPAVLLIERDDAPESSDFLHKLTESGSQVDHLRMSGYEDFATDGEETSVLPWPTLHGIEDWLDLALPAAVLPASNGAPVEPVVESATLAIEEPTVEALPTHRVRGCVIEEPIRVDDRFFALRTSPGAPASGPRVSVVLFNTGSVSRIGPGRLYVSLGRYLASLGFVVTRIDLGGAGDSLDVDPATENQPLAPARIQELRDAVAWIREQSGGDPVVAGGLCSGAFNAFHAATDGMHVDNLLIVNPGTFYLGADELQGSDEAVLASAHKLTRGFLNGRRWRLALTDRDAMRQGLKAVRYWFRANPMSGYRVLAGAWVRRTARRVGIPVKERSALARDFEAIVARGVKLLIVIAAGESAAQYVRSFGGPLCDGRSDQTDLDFVYIDGGDHTFASPGGRQRFIEVVTAYLEREYPSTVTRSATEAAGQGATPAPAPRRDRPSRFAIASDSGLGAPS